MEHISVGVIINGVTGRMGTRQHLERSILAIRQQGGLKLPAATIMPEPILVGRNADKLKSMSQQYGGLPFSTDLSAVLSDKRYPVYFDSQATNLRIKSVTQAIAASKHVYCEKPIAETAAEALEL